jgi:hypothetical protein
MPSSSHAGSAAVNALRDNAAEVPLADIHGGCGQVCGKLSPARDRAADFRAFLGIA